MDFAIWVKRYVGSRYFHIDDVLRVFDHYGEAQVYVDNEGREEMGWIDGPDIEKIRNYKPEVAELSLVGHIRRIRREAGAPWSYRSFFDEELVPEPDYIVTCED
jgi:hypothetical protein